MGADKKVFKVVWLQTSWFQRHKLVSACPIFNWEISYSVDKPSVPHITFGHILCKEVRPIPKLIKEKLATISHNVSPIFAFDEKSLARDFAGFLTNSLVYESDYTPVSKQVDEIFREYLGESFYLHTGTVFCNSLTLRKQI